ncbi:MAG: chromosome segregation protein SMC [Clostridiales bacterium]|nr:chromosome segregation protein SMC [Clostridiales bacterium]
MRLKKLEIHGFKSFAERTEIVFNQGITGIVGPNGSGKSNIGDAVRWVLGEQSARVLRGAKMEDVIFNGTAKRKPASYCEVSLVFDNEDGALKSNFAEVMVTRRVYRNGDSEYYLNKTACRLKDILELFRDTGIGREGYSLIGQGRIDEILSVKSEDRRQVFEEAAGVMTYRVRKEEAERKLNRTRDNLSRVNDILEELASRVEPLEKQAAVAKEYLELAERLKDLEINIFLIRHDKVKERIAALDQTLEGLRDVLLQHEARLNENAAEREKLEEAIALLEEELVSARAEHLAATESWHEGQAEQERTRHQIETGKENIARLAGEIEDARKKQRDLQILFDQGEKDAEKNDEALSAARQELDDEQNRLDQFLQDAQEKEETLDRHKADILSAVNRLSDAKNQQARQQAICAQMKNRLAEIEQAVIEGGEKQQQLVQALRSVEKQADEVQQGLQSLKDDAASCEGNLRALTQETQETAEKAQNLNLKYQADVSRLRLMDEMSREMEGYNQSVRRALSYAQNDKSVKGVVARLMQVPAELETAIDMVLGGALQNIVTENEESAKRLIDYLRANRLGRATFLPMTSVKGRVLNNEERKLLSMPGCLGVASELISYDPQYQGIMENLLGRTVIAKDLDSGIPIMRAGRHAFRLVTLTGDVMHSGGSMTGGTAQKSAVSLLGREREMKELQKTLENEKRDLAAMRDRLTQMQLEREELKRLRNEAMERVHQEEIAVAREQERVFNAKAELTAAQQQLEKTRLAQAQLRESIAEIEEDLAAVKLQTENETIDREAMDQKTEELQKALLSAREKAELQRDLVTKMRLKFAELSHTLDTLRRDKMRRDQELASLADALARLEQEKTLRENMLREAEAQLARQTENCAELEQEAIRKQNHVQSLDEKRQEKSARQRECVRFSEEMHKQYDEDSIKLHRTELSHDRAENDLKVMTDHIFNTYDLTYAIAEEFRAEGQFDLTGSEREAASLRGRIREMGHVNVGAIEEYAATKERFDDLSTQKEDLTKAEEDLQTLITRLLSQMEKQFTAEFAKLGEYFKETFARLFGGGQAELRLTDPDDALNCGIEIIAQPPGKKLQLLSLLSGGERALTAIAILFAMLKLKPTPFCILDEIEAALDEANIGYFADYLTEYAKTTQFVVVTHRKGTMEHCDALYGVAMQERGISGMVSVNLQDYE